MTLSMVRFTSSAARLEAEKQLYSGPLRLRPSTRSGMLVDLTKPTRHIEVWSHAKYCTIERGHSCWECSSLAPLVTRIFLQDRLEHKTASSGHCSIAE